MTSGGGGFAASARRPITGDLVTVIKPRSRAARNARLLFNSAGKGPMTSFVGKGFLDKKMDGKLFARVTEGLIASNLGLVPELEEFANFLAQYNPDSTSVNFFKNEDLKKEIKKNKLLSLSINIIPIGIR